MEKGDHPQYGKAMKSLLSRIGERLALFGAVLGMMTAGQVSSVAQSFTSPGGIGFSIAPGNYTAVLGSTNYLPVTLHYTNDVLNDYDGDSADGSYRLHRRVLRHAVRV